VAESEADKVTQTAGSDALMMRLVSGWVLQEPSFPPFSFFSPSVLALLHLKKD